MRNQVTIPVEGERLFGIFDDAVEKGNPGGRPAVLILHGIAGTKVEPHRLLVQLADGLAERGIPSLRFDFRGCGDSDGDFVETTFASMMADAHSALTWLRSRSEVDPECIGVMGLSLGGTLAAYLSKTAPKIVALALWAPMAKYVPKWFEGLHDDLEVNGEADMDGDRLGVDLVKALRQCDPLREIGDFSGDALLVHGSNDHVVPIAHSHAYREVLARNGQRVKVHVIPGADHTFNSVPWTNDAINVSADWFKDVLL